VRDDQNNEDKKMKKYETALPCDLTADSAYYACFEPVEKQKEILESIIFKCKNWKTKASKSLAGEAKKYLQEINDNCAQTK
jgi:hypothetical protein